MIKVIIGTLIIYSSPLILIMVLNFLLGSFYPAGNLRTTGLLFKIHNRCFASGFLVMMMALVFILPLQMQESIRGLLLLAVFSVPYVFLLQLAWRDQLKHQYLQSD